MQTGTPSSSPLWPNRARVHLCVKTLGGPLTRPRTHASMPNTSPRRIEEHMLSLEDDMMDLPERVHGGNPPCGTRPRGHRNVFAHLHVQPNTHLQRGSLDRSPTHNVQRCGDTPAGTMSPLWLLLLLLGRNHTVGPEMSVHEREDDSTKTCSDSLLQLPFHAFWSSVIHDRTLQNFFDTFLRFSPKSFDFVWGKNSQVPTFP